jgi:hypothetical protein
MSIRRKRAPQIGRATRYKNPCIPALTESIIFKSNENKRREGIVELGNIDLARAKARGRPKTLTGI